MISFFGAFLKRAIDPEPQPTRIVIMNGRIVESNANREEEDRAMDAYRQATATAQYGLPFQSAIAASPLHPQGDSQQPKDDV